MSGTTQGDSSADEWVDSLWASHTEKVYAAKPQIETLLSEVSGWHGVGKLADWVIKLIIANQGRSGDEDVRPPCWEEHAPLTVSEMTNLLTEHFGIAADDSRVIQAVEQHRQKLVEEFGLEYP